jgi:hypothetical protein
MTDTHTRSCFCRAVEIEVTGAPEEMGYCHCRSCRSYSGGPVSAFILWKSEKVKVTQGAEFLGRFQKTDIEPYFIRPSNLNSFFVKENFSPLLWSSELAIYLSIYQFSNALQS